MTTLGIVVAEFNEEITMKMLDAATKAAKESGCAVGVVAVPGAFEIPFAVQQLLKRGGVDAIVALGAIIQGDTYHDVIIGENVSRKIMDLSLAYDVPVSLSVIGPRVTWEQAQERAESYAEHGVAAVLAMIKVKEACKKGSTTAKTAAKSLTRSS